MNRFAPVSLTKFIALATLSVAFAFTQTSCTTTSSQGVAVEGELTTPEHGMGKSEYPFDAKGNYREDWVSFGSSSSSSSSSGSKSTSSSSSTRRTTASTSSGSSSSGSTSAVSSSGSSSSSTVMVANTQPVPSSKYHTVSKNDTLWAISRNYGVSVSALKSANGLSSDIIKPGQRLKIP